MTFPVLLTLHVALSLLGAMLVHRYFRGQAEAGRVEAQQTKSGEVATTITVLEIGTIVAWLGAEYLVGSLLAVPLGLSGFGVIHLAYLQLFVCVPVIGVLLAGVHFSSRSPGQLTHGAKALVCAALGLGGLGYYITDVVPFDLEVTHTTLDLSKEGDTESPAYLRIGLLADLQAEHVTDYERVAVAALMAEKPDLILISGDVIDQRERAEYIKAIPEFRELLATLSAPAGIYFVQGNTDPKGIEPMLFEGTEIIGLRDRIVSIPFGQHTIALGGIALAHHRVPKGKAIMEALATPSDDGDIRLLLTHLPDPVLYLPENSAIDLVLAGHTHGGQVQIPFYGPPITLSKVPRAIAGGGLHEYQGNAIYVSRGIGVERAQAPRMRFLARPEVSLITLEL